MSLAPIRIAAGGRWLTSGHTLVELLAVILIAGLLAAAVVFRSSSLTQKMRLELALGRLEHLDAAARTHARSHGRPSKLEIELGSSRISRRFGAPNGRSKTESLGAHVAVRHFLTAAHDTTTGRATVEYSPEGISPTYAVELAFAGRGEQPVWLVFLGSTGQVLRLESEREVFQLVQRAPAGTDAR